MNFTGDQGVSNYLALRNVKTRMTIRNLSTYAIRLRVTTWVCRNSVPNGAVSGTGPVVISGNDLDQVLEAGFEPPYADDWGSNPSADLTDVSSSAFQNPLWLYYFKAIKTKRRYLKPYQELTETIHQLKRRAGLIWEGGNAAPPASSGSLSNGTPNWQLAQSGSGGVTTVVKTIEMVGELITDDTALPDTAVFNAPVVWSTQLEISWESAYLSSSVFLSGGDPEPPTVDMGRTGNRTNYMQYGGASGTDPTGSSSVVGALTTGI